MGVKIVVSREKLERLGRETRQAVRQAAGVAAEAAAAVGRRAENAVAMARLERAAADVEEEIALQMQAVGELLYATHRGTPSDSDDIQQILEYVDGLYEELEGYRLEQRKLAGERPCPVCGGDNQPDDAYCRTCGQPLGGI